MAVQVRGCEGVEQERLRECLRDETDYLKKADVEYVLEFLEESRAEFGRLAGRCGCCGKTLTDPDSKMRGIGPECIKGIQR